MKKENLTITREFDLPCFDGRKNFYGKAKVIETAEGRYLQSYNTLVCFLSNDGKIFKKLWWNYSATTMRHVNSFLRFYDISKGGKAWWDSLEEDKEYYTDEF